MSTEVNKAFVQQFSGNVIHLAQQKSSRLMNLVRNKQVVGKYAHFDRIGATVAQKRTSRHQDSVIVDTPHSRRRVSMNDYEIGDLIDSEDEIRMLIDPASEYAKAMAMALGRSIDDEIIAAAVGNAVSIDSSDSSSNVAVAHTIDEDYTTANSDIIFEKVVEAKRILLGNEVDPEEDFYFILDSIAAHNLLKETEIGSGDYNRLLPLMNGKLENFMGFNFVLSERLSDSSEGFKQCLAIAGSGIGLAVGKEPYVSIDKRPDKGNSKQVLAKMTVGATRIEEEKVVVVEAYRA